jgi:regulation of enolase protein 1 (concanavalin A-like superfamily)
MAKASSMAAVLVIVSATIAAPLREVTKKPVWGTFEDPDKDCTFKEENTGLSITIQGKDHDLAVERGKMNSPRAVQPVDGDFVIQVKVTGRFEPRQMDTTERSAYHGAGIFVRKDDSNYITLDRATYWDGTQNQVYANFELRAGGQIERFGSPNDLRLDNTQDTWLKIERKGNEFKAYATQKAGEWQALGARTLEAPKQIHVGVAARNSSLEPFTPRFSEFKLSKDNLQKNDK